jgi:hypothetical protein
VSALAWWLIPLAATVLALLWADWRSRPRRPADAHVAMEDMARFKQAMERPLPAGQRRRRSGRGSATGGPVAEPDRARDTAA